MSMRDGLYETGKALFISLLETASPREKSRLDYELTCSVPV